MLKINGGRESKKTNAGWKNFSGSEWEKGLQLAEEMDKVLAPARDRLNSVFEFLMENLINGSLKSALRKKAGGNIGLPLETDFWNIDNPWIRFHSCQVDPRYPFSTSVQGTDHEFIFVEKAGFHSLISVANFANPDKLRPVNIPDDIYLSPYMQLMVEAIRHHKITDETHGNVEAIATWFRQEAKSRDLKMSNRLSEAMATAVRHPDAQQGRNPTK